MKKFLALLITLGLAGPALAESCSKSREYILDGLAGDLLEPATRYQELFKICAQTLTLGNVKDAYLLKDGGIAILPARNTMVATAETLSQFCQLFPQSVVRFLTSSGQSRALTIGYVVMMSSRGVTTCKEIRGLS
jgi:hypothetical protein